ncbi:hypothetical protein ES703_37554 [subsurface metagenome]
MLILTESEVDRKLRNEISWTKDEKKYFTSVTSEPTINRIYYSLFYEKEFVETRLGKFYSDMFDRRQEGDYKDFVSFEKCDVEMWSWDALQVQGSMIL